MQMHQVCTSTPKEGYRIQISVSSYHAHCCTVPDSLVHTYISYGVPLGYLLCVQTITNIDANAELSVGPSAGKLFVPRTDASEIDLIHSLLDSGVVVVNRKGLVRNNSQKSVAMPVRRFLTH